MLKKLDLYIIKRFLTTFIVALGLFTLIIIIFDVSEKLDDFVEKKAPLYDIVVKYYINFIPYILNLFSPFFVFLTVIFFTSKLAEKSEIVAMIASGVTYNRFLRPYVLVALLFGMISFLLNAWIIPRSDKIRMKFENTYIRNLDSEYQENIIRQIQPGVVMSLGSFNRMDSAGYNLSIEWFKEGRVVKKLYADRITWAPQKKMWKIANYRYRSIMKDGNESLVFGDFLDTLIPFVPNDFFMRVDDVQSFNMKELDVYIGLEEMRGTGRSFFYITEKYRRYSAPFSLLLLTFIGVCVSSSKKRGGIGINLAVGLFISFAYLFIIQWFISYGSTGSMAPALAVWLPNLMFLPVAYYFYASAQK
ncbi:MAG: LptF/LptG family permease [Flavobacteriales bacterium]|nr:LptF/LptG family permease [Flavobacteriales bacterium]